LSRPAATLSVDVDPVDLHLVGYGHHGLDPDPLVYQAALPRLLEVFARVGVRATFFVVGRDAAAHAGRMRALAAQGHEIASHTFSHPFAFARLPEAEMRQELEGSRRALEEASGSAVVGFRSPNFDLDEPALAAVAGAGFRYDASGYPTLMLIPARLLLAWKSRSGDALRLRMRPFTWRRDPHVRSAGGRTLVEFPVSVTRGIRFPIYHTARYVLGRARFEGMLDALAARGETLSYPLHAVDALGLAEDRVDARLARHPGMELPLATKLALLEESLAAIVRRFEPAPFAERLARFG
jgi:predicted deacetylase